MAELPTDKRDPEVANSDSRSSGAPPWFLWPCLFVIIYILSTGPVLHLAVAGTIPGPVFKAVYAPVIVLAHHCAPFRSLMQWYIGDVWQNGTRGL